MKIEINYLFDRDTHVTVKEFTATSSILGKSSSVEDQLAEWLRTINSLGFFKVQTEKGDTLVPVRNINFILRRG